MATDLAKLRYDPKWLEYGFVSEPYLDEQLAKYERDGDEDAEHYRYDSFRRLLEAVSTLDDVTIDRYIELAALDEDQTMAQAALGLLVRHDGLTQQQLSRLRMHPIFASRELQASIEQTQLLRDLDSSNIADDVFERCVALGKGEVQRKLLSKSGISPQQLAAVADRGANRAIRNLAKNKLSHHQLASCEGYGKRAQRKQ